MPSITTLILTTALTTVENKTPDVSNLVKKADYNTKVSEIERKIADQSHDKYITTLEFNKLTAENFAARLPQANLLTKTDFDDKLINLNEKTNSNKTKSLIVENEFKKSETFDSLYLHGKSHFEGMVVKIIYCFNGHIDILKQLVLMIVIFYHGNLKDCLMKVLSLLLHLIKMLNHSANYVGTKATVKFNRNCLKQEKTLFDHGKIVNIYIVYEISVIQHWKIVCLVQLN